MSPDNSIRTSTDFWGVRGRLDDYVVFGETVNDQDGALDTRFSILNNIRYTDGFTKQMATWNVAGFRQSDLYVMRTGTADQGKTVLRPWNYLMEHELKRAPSITWSEKEADPANPSEKAVIESPRDLTQPPYRPQLEWGAARYKVPHNLSSYTGSSTGARPSGSKSTTSTSALAGNDPGLLAKSDPPHVPAEGA